jgi:hypothetical protein
MPLYQSEKNWMEKFANIIPGLKSYRSHESRRDTDKRLRDYLASRIDGIRKKIDDINLDLTNQKKIELLDDVDNLNKKIRKLADMLRHASYGYTGVFDQVKMRDAELDRLYSYDVQLQDSIDVLIKDTDAFAAETMDEPLIKTYRDKLKTLETLIEERKIIFNNPEQSLPENNKE